MKVMFCNHCGKANPDDARLCAFCGASLTGGVTERRLVRPRAGRRIAGVCAGVAQYYGWNVTTIRLLWLAGGPGINSARCPRFAHPLG